MALLIAAIMPGRRVTAKLYHEDRYLGKVVVLEPFKFIAETKNGRKGRFNSVETCARFCGFPISETIELHWHAEERQDGLVHKENYH
jgi:hypothetical protein